MACTARLTHQPEAGGDTKRQLTLNRQGVISKKTDFFITTAQNFWNITACISAEFHRRFGKSAASFFREMEAKETTSKTQAVSRAIWTIH
jgi:hypothetical protein